MNLDDIAAVIRTLDQLGYTIGVRNNITARLTEEDIYKLTREVGNATQLYSHKMRHSDEYDPEPDYDRPTRREAEIERD